MEMDAKTTTTKVVKKQIGIYAKLHLAKQSIGKVTKNATNPHFKKPYADINALLEAVEPILWENGLVLLQPIKDGMVITQIIDIESGDMVESWLQLPNIIDPQKMLSAVTYYRRGTLLSLCALQSVDDDGNTASASPKANPILSNERFEKALEKIAEGKFSVEQLVSTYALSDLQLKALQL